SLKGLNIDNHIMKAQGELSGIAAKAFGNLRTEIFDATIKRGQVDVDQAFRQIDVDASNRMLELQPGWENSEEGMAHRDSILKEMITRKQEALESKRGTVGADFYKDYNLKVAENATQELLKTQALKHQFMLKEHAQKRGDLVGSTAQVVSGIMARQSRDKSELGFPPYETTSENREEIDFAIGLRLQAVQVDNTLRPEEKKSLVFETILASESTYLKDRFNRVTGAETPEHALRIDGVVQKNLETGNLILDPKITSAKMNQIFEEELSNLKDGKTKERYMKAYKLSSEEAEDLITRREGALRDSVEKYKKQMDNSIARESEASLNRKTQAQFKVYEAGINAGNQMKKAVGQGYGISEAYSLLTDNPLRASNMDNRDDEGLNSFEKTFEVNIKSLNSENIVVSGMYSEEEFRFLKNAKDTETISTGLSALFKDIKDPETKTLALKSLAYKAQESNIPINMDALLELSKTSSSQYNVEKRDMIESVITDQLTPFTEKAESPNFNNGGLNVSKKEMTVAFGGSTGYDMFIRYCRYKQDELKGKYPKLEKSLNEANKGGKISKVDFEIAILNATKEDSLFKDFLRSKVDVVRDLSAKKALKPMTLSGEETDRLAKIYSEKKVNEAKSHLQKAGIMDFGNQAQENRPGRY
ncbi:MAG: hypothetical protein ACRC0G_06905, partial [Fusobacteriaceae bacterium]